MMRLQNGIHARVANRAVVFLTVWKIWAQISIEAPVIRSHRALPRLMKAMLDNRQRLENMIGFSVVNSGANFAVFIDVPLLETS